MVKDVIKCNFVKKKMYNLNISKRCINVNKKKNLSGISTREQLSQIVMRTLLIIGIGVNIVSNPDINSPNMKLQIFF